MNVNFSEMGPLPEIKAEPKLSQTQRHRQDDRSQPDVPRRVHHHRHRRRRRRLLRRIRICRLQLGLHRLTDRSLSEKRSTEEGQFLENGSIIC